MNMKEFEEEVGDFEISLKKINSDDNVIECISGRSSDLLMGLTIIIGSLIADARISKENIRIAVEAALSEEFSEILQNNIKEKQIEQKIIKKKEAKKEEQDLIDALKELEKFLKELD